jgi:hypothetical protein
MTRRYVAVIVDVNAGTSMKVVYSENRAPVDPDPTVAKVLGEVSPDNLRTFILN